MKEQVGNNRGRKVKADVSRASSDVRRIIYLKDENISLSERCLTRIKCPGHCACASKKKG